MKFYIVDAFADDLFKGNQAGVVLLEGDFPSKERMIKTAKELKYSETAFIKRINEKEFNIRYFTPADEVDLCGHATIASFYTLCVEGYISDGNYMNHTLAGDLNIEIKNGMIYMDMAEPKEIEVLSDEQKLEELYEIMGLKYKKMDFLPKIINAGLPDIMMPVLNQKELDSISPDFKKLSELSKKYNVTGVHAFCIDDGIHTRNFAPLYDIDEEAATGTSNGALTYYLYKEDVIKPRDVNEIIQGEKMGRKSIIKTIIYDEHAIKVGGRGKILAKGELYI